jgi:GNAT superfamily N-acetyltransferase
VKVRPASVADADACGRVIHAAFGAVNERHGYESRWPSVAFASRFAEAFIGNPGIHGILAEDRAGVVGCNFLDERGSVHGVGPTAVAPSAQGGGIGRALMEAVLNRSAGPVRLLQDSFNTASLSLYASLGFEVKEPIALMAGLPRDAPSDPAVGRPLAEGDLAACGELCRRVHGFDRTTELAEAIRETARTPLALGRDGQVVAYSSGFGTFAHAVAAAERDMRELILAAGARADGSLLEFLVPIRSGSLFRWALDQGFAVVKTMNLMTRGPYREPTGSWCPSVLY